MLRNLLYMGILIGGLAIYITTVAESDNCKRCGLVEVSTRYSDMYIRLDTVRAIDWRKSGDKWYVMKEDGGEYWSDTPPIKIVDRK